MKKSILILMVLVVSGCSKVYYCNEGEILDKDKCKSLIEAKFKYYCAEGTGELKKDKCVNGEVTSEALKEYYCEKGILTTDDNGVYSCEIESEAKSRIKVFDSSKEIEKDVKEKLGDLTKLLDGVSYDEDKINVYMFWGDGCPHCEKESNWFNEIESEYGAYFKLNKFEVWKNSDNKELLSITKELLGSEATGVPFTVIGDTVISGFGEGKKKFMLDLITSEYKNSYDVYFNRK